ncbi:MAG: thioredoxin family protein [Phycisphaerae bacterium]|nr:thioredoxin family protein [Phycisphaerae bacterium]
MRCTHTVAMVLLVTVSVQARRPDVFAPFALETGEAAKKQHLTVRAVVSHKQAAPGDTFYVAADIAVEKGWVFYSPDPGMYAKGAQIVVQANGLAIGNVLWPASHKKVTDLPGQKVVNNVYEGRTIVYVPVTVPTDAKPRRYEIRLTVNGQVCKTSCIDLRNVTASTSTTVGAVALANPEWKADPAFADGLARAPATGADRKGPDEATWVNLALALLAGLALNIMPCVLPIIPLRIHSVVEMAKGSRRRFITLGLAFAAGICLFFVAFAAANIALKLLAGRTLNWSEQWQLPGVRIAMGLLVIAVACNLFGAFNITVPRKVAGLEAGSGKRQQGHTASLGMGLMMAILSTPCSAGPLLGVLGWAQTQTLRLGTLVIVLLGVGMAAPHAALCAFPNLVNKLPRPGRWMELFKHSMGFVLLLLAVFLLATVGKVSIRVVRVMYFGVLLASCLWVWGTWVRFDTPTLRKWTVRGAAIVLVTAAGFWMLPEPAKPLVKFQDFDPVKIEAARKEGKTVLIEFTASWCIECKVIDAFVYNTPEVAEKLKDPDILVMKADVTDHDSPASQYLRQAGSGSPPETLIYPAGGGRQINLPGSLTKDRLLTEVSRARPKQKKGS